MWRLARAAILLAVAVLAASWLADRPGAVSVVWQGWRVDTSVGIVAALLLLLIGLTALLVRLWRALVQAPRAALAGRRARRELAGWRALTDGLVAIAAGDAAEARRKAAQADALLGRPPEALLLAAQSAQLVGDDSAAQRHFQALSEQRATEMIGLRGLVGQALRAGDRAAALTLAERAHQRQPNAMWADEALFRLHAQAGDWTQAQAALDRLGRGRSRDRALSAGRRAALLVERGRQAAAEGRADEALALARRAHEMAPELVPATALLARLLVANGARRKAERLLLAAWARTPHPELAEAFGATLDDSDALGRARAFATLAAANPLHAESGLAAATAALDAHLWGEARSRLAKAGNSPRTLRLLARVEEGETGDATAARALLDRAMALPPEAGWACGECGAPSFDGWHAVCGRCGAVGGLLWGDAAPALPPPVGV